MGNWSDDKNSYNKIIRRRREQASQSGRGIRTLVRIAIFWRTCNIVLLEIASRVEAGARNSAALEILPGMSINSDNLNWSNSNFEKIFFCIFCNIFSLESVWLIDLISFFMSLTSFVNLKLTKFQILILISIKVIKSFNFIIKF